MFIELKDIVVNLNQVSNVGFLDHRNRMVFNFSHSIELQNHKTNEWNTIADYKYYDLSEDDYYTKKKQIQQSLLQDGFLEPMHFSHYWINPKSIAYVNYDDKKHRLIFNLSTSVTKDTGKGVTLINDFVFWTFNTEQELQEASASVQRSLLS